MTHGTLEGYKTGCRCPKCVELWNMYNQEFRENIFDDTKAKTKKVNINSINMTRAYKEYTDKDVYL